MSKKNTIITIGATFFVGFSVFVFSQIVEGLSLKKPDFFQENQAAQIGSIDVTAPTIAKFSVPAIASSVTVPITLFTAMDSVGVVGYIVTENPNPPSVNDAGWSTNAPKTFVVSEQGLSKILLLFVTESLATHPDFLAWKQQVVSEGWLIDQRLVPATLWNDAQRESRAKQILQEIHTVRPKAVLFVGGVARAAMGKSAPDGHTARAQWADFVFNGMIEPSQLTDNELLVSGESHPQWNNVPGDGRWDQQFLLGPARWAVGRVDFFDLGGMPRKGTIKSTTSYLNGTLLIPAVDEWQATGDYFRRNLAYRTGQQVYQNKYYYDNVYLEPNWLNTVRTSMPSITFSLFSTPSNHRDTQQSGAGEYFYGMYPFFTLYEFHHNWSDLSQMAKVVWMSVYKSYEQDPYYSEFYLGEQGVRRWLQHALFVMFGPPKGAMFNGGNVTDGYLHTFGDARGYSLHYEVAGDPTLPWDPAVKTVYPSGIKTLYAYVKDAAGNVSSAAKASLIVIAKDAGSGTPTPGPVPPTPPIDTQVPVITTFTLPATSSPGSIPIAISATDNVAVTGYLVQTSSVPPAVSATGWSNSAPTQYVVTVGTTTLYAYAKDAAGNISSPVQRTIVVSVPFAIDNTVPTIVDFVLPATSQSLNVPVLRFEASDNVGVIGYMLYGAANKPSPASTGWSTTPPTKTAYAFAGQKTVYGFVKDAAGNVSVGVRRDVLVDPTPPGLPGTVSVSRVTDQLVHITWGAATDNLGVAAYTIARNGVAIATTSDLSFVDTVVSPLTTYTYSIRAVDGVGHRSAPVTVSAQTLASAPAPDVEKPRLTVRMPLDGAATTGVMTLMVDVQDNRGVGGVLFAIDGVFIGEEKLVSPYIATYDTRLLAEGLHTLEAVARDTSGNTDRVTWRVRVERVSVPTIRCTQFLYTEWSECSGGVHVRSVRERIPSGCVGDPTEVLSRQCVMPPVRTEPAPSGGGGGGGGGGGAAAWVPPAKNFDASTHTIQASTTMSLSGAATSSQMVPVVNPVLSTVQTFAPAMKARSFEGVLVPGSRGEHVKVLQEFLVSIQLLTQDAVTGYFGPMTTQAVQRYQREFNIVTSGTPDTTGYGMVGKKTRASMEAYQGGGGTSVSAPIAMSAAVASTSKTLSAADIQVLQKQIDMLLAIVADLMKQLVSLKNR